MFSYVNVNGENINELWKYLSACKQNLKGGSGEINDEWTKFLVDHNGRVVDVFEPNEDLENIGILSMYNEIFSKLHQNQ